MDSKPIESKLDARELQHMQNCASLLHTSSPNASRHIASVLLARARRLELNETAEILSEHFCGTCGSLAVPGESCTMKRSSIKYKVRKKDLERSNVVMRLRKCLNCDRTQTLRSVKKPSRGAMMAAQKRIVTHAKSVDGSLSNQVKEQVTAQASAPRLASPINSKSKDRKKNRSKGLASLLAASKASSAANKQSSSGLDLSDFMI